MTFGALSAAWPVAGPVEAELHAASDSTASAASVSTSYQRECGRPGMADSGCDLPRQDAARSLRQGGCVVAGHVFGVLRLLRVQYLAFELAHKRRQIGGFMLTGIRAIQRLK